MIQFVKNYNKNIDTAECYLNINDKTNEKHFQICFIEPSIIFGDKRATFSLPNYTLDYRFGFNDSELCEIVNFIKNNESIIYDELKNGLKIYQERNRL